MPTSTGTQRSSPRAARYHPHPTRRRTKGKSAAARRKEKRGVAKVTGMSPVYNSTLLPQAQPLVSRSFLLSHQYWRKCMRCIGFSLVTLGCFRLITTILLLLVQYDN